MTRESCIAHPPNSRFTMIREDYLALVNDNACAAALLNDLEQWHNAKLRGREQAVEHNRAARQSDVEATQDTELWVYKTQAEFKTELLGIWSERTIATALQLLYDKGFIETRTNPKYKWDRTTQFLFNEAAVQLALYENTGYGPAQIDILQKRIMEDENLQNGFGKNAEAIPEITTKITTEDSKNLQKSLRASAKSKPVAQEPDTSKESEEAPKKKVAAKKKAPADVPPPGEKVLEIICFILYETQDAWATNASLIRKTYNEIAAAEQALGHDPINRASLVKFWNWWKDPFANWRWKSTPGTRPSWQQVIELWATAQAYKKGQHNDSTAERQVLGEKPNRFANVKRARIPGR